MKSRLGFAIATCMKPDILIADEVLATGDKNFQLKCEQRMQELLADGTTLLFVSHSAAQIRKMCNKVMWIDRGTVKMVGDTEDVMSVYDQPAKT